MRPYTQVRPPPPPLEAWDPLSRPHSVLPGGGLGSAAPAGEDEEGLASLGLESGLEPCLEPRPVPGADFDGSLPPPTP
eukprot:10281477-Lingulodinium_polyedra.AAC.1